MIDIGEAPFVDVAPPVRAYRQALVALLYLFFSAYLRYGISRFPPGLARALLAAPIFVANTAVPFFFSNKEELLQRLVLVFILTWLANSKVFCFCFGRPPLADSMTTPQIAALLLLPVFPKPPEGDSTKPTGRLQDSAGSPAKLAARWTVKIAVLGVLVYLLLTYGNVVPHVVRHVMYFFALYSFVGFIMDGPGAVLVGALGLELVPTFDQPWMSDCLADFWARRWNITTSSVLRTSVYDIVMDGCLVNPRYGKAGGTAVGSAAAAAGGKGVAGAGGVANGITADGRGGPAAASPGPNGPRPPRPHQPRRATFLRRTVAVHATFLVSALVHEYIAWVVDTRGVWGWKWTVFFSVQAPLLCAEAAAGRWLRRRHPGVRVPQLLCIVVTLVMLEALAYDLFFGFVEHDTDLATRVTLAVAGGYQGLAQQLRPRLAAFGSRGLGTGAEL